jgi:hypothetical protein
MTQQAHWKREGEHAGDREATEMRANRGRT